MWQVVGYPEVVGLLEHSLKAGSLAHAYLFVGPPHVGKMTLALNLAQALNCDSAPPPCGECLACHRISRAKHADVRIISLTSEVNSANGKPGAEISIDEIREIVHSANLLPYEGKQRVFIIDGAEYLSSEAANCLLKTLEEPPPRVYLLLLSARERSLLPTMVSRCQRLELRPVSIKGVEMLLIQQWHVNPERAQLVARLSRGCLGWALTALSDEMIFRQRAEKIATLISLSTASYQERFAYAAELATQFDKGRREMEEVPNFWLGWWRDLLLVRIGYKVAITNIDQEATLHHWAAGLTMEQIKNFIDSILAAQEQLSSNANPRLVLEVLMFKMPRGRKVAQGKVGK